MRYDDVVEQIHRRVAAAPPEVVAAVGAATVERLVRNRSVTQAAEAELDEDARAAFVEAAATFRVAAPERIQELLGLIDLGATAGGEMDPALTFALDALQEWQTFRATGNPDFVAVIAEGALEAADFREPGEADDFLASAETAAEHERILGALDPAS